MTGLYALEVGSALSYVMAVLVPALDVLVPVLPSETVVIALGVATASSADPRVGVLVALAAFGAFLGDNVAYLAGRRFGPAVDRRLFAGERGTRRRCWARRSLERFGIRIIIGCRFIPGGRTAVTLTCGLIGYPRRRFAAATACAGIAWACYAFFLGRLGGKVFEHQPWIGLLLALGLALAVSLFIEAARRAWRWHASASHRIRRPPPAGQQRRAGRQAVLADPSAADDLSPVSARTTTAHADHDAESPKDHRGRGDPGYGPRRGIVPDLRDGPNPAGQDRGQLSAAVAVHRRAGGRPGPDAGSEDRQHRG